MRLSNGFSGSLLLTCAGATLLAASGGLADASADTPCTADTRFQIASVSKQLAAAVVMDLVDDGSFTLTDPLGRLLPTCAPRWRDLTLHQLLSHTAGLEHWDAVPGFDVTRPGGPDELLERLARVPLRDAPAGTWHYSSPGYLLAARVAESVSGTPYADLLSERVLRPLEMTATVVGCVPPEPVAWGYREGQRVDVAQFSALPGTGDVWSTVGDLARYAKAFERGEILSAASRRAMVSRQADLPSPSDPDDPAPAWAYGYGLFLGTLGGHRARFHPGDNPGYRSFLGYLPDLRATLVILVDDEGTDLDALLRDLVPELARIEAGRPR